MKKQGKKRSKKAPRTVHTRRAATPTGDVDDFTLERALNDLRSETKAEREEAEERVRKAVRRRGMFGFTTTT